MPIYYEIESISEFYNILQNNNSAVVIKFGADWCVPCGKIKKHVDSWFEKLNNQRPDMELIYIDVDKSFEIYAFLKTKKMIQGIPAILAYYKGNISFAFDDSVSGTDEMAINTFFETVLYKTVSNDV